jgi:hypothetical protein
MDEDVRQRFVANLEKSLLYHKVKRQQEQIQGESLPHPGVGHERGQSPDYNGRFDVEFDASTALAEGEDWFADYADEGQEVPDGAVQKLTIRCAHKGCEHTVVGSRPQDVSRSMGIHVHHEHFEFMPTWRERLHPALKEGGEAGYNRERVHVLDEQDREL